MKILFFLIRNFLGAFADGAVLFSLLVALSVSTNASPVVLLVTSGAAYLAAAFLFRIPMPVQPLKSLAIAGLALGASQSEIRVGGAVLGFVCVCLTLCDVNRLAQKVPASLIHGLQLALGILLISQGAKYARGLADNPFQFFLLVGLVVVILGFYFIPSRFSSFPLLGLVATAGLAYAVFFTSGNTQRVVLSDEAIRYPVLAGLIFPQLALTLTNSVLATHDVAHRYFSTQANRVTIRRLLQSIGFGNILSSLVGGLPFCHGSGGLTAHVRGGATHWVSNVFIGMTLLSFAAVILIFGDLFFQYPKVLISSLLIGIGVFHIGLAKPTWIILQGKIQLIGMGIVALISLNMLYVLFFGILSEFAFGLLTAQKKWVGSQT